MSSGTPIRLSIINHYEIVVKGLQAMLEPFGDRVVVVETEAGGLPVVPADIALFDTFASRRRSLSRIDEIADDRRFAKMVLYTWDLPKNFEHDIDLRSVDSVIMKDTTGSALVEALESVHRGDSVGLGSVPRRHVQTTLTEREREVLALLAQGATNRAIATELYISFDTVKSHVRKVFAKLGVSNRTQAAVTAREYGLESPVRCSVA